MAKAVLGDAESVAMMRQTRSTLDYGPREDGPVPLVNDADVTKLHPAKAPQMKKLVKPLLQGLLGAKEEKARGTMNYDGALDGTGEGALRLRRPRCADDLLGFDSRS